MVCFPVAAFGFWDDPLRPFNATIRLHETSRITWRVVEDVQAACNAERVKNGGAPYGYPINACSTFWKEINTCIIITEKSTTMHTLGHEVRHCFQGHWH